MTATELRAMFDGPDWKATSAVIESEGDRGIALKLGENLSGLWKSGDVIVFWEDGDHTELPDDFALVQFNPFRLEVAKVN